jgi:TolB-like protein/DNA-binding SARP family transcriptional activator/cytochrome c-type biogenesis protein CcmH/NrfG
MSGRKIVAAPSRDRQRCVAAWLARLFSVESRDLQVRPRENSMPLTLELFGGFRLVDAERRTVHVPDRRARALIAYLALAESAVPRRALAELLCSEGDEQDQRTALRQAVYVARKAATEPDLVVTVQAQIDLNGALLVSDVGRFQAAIARGDPDSLSEAVELYRGPLLAGERSPSAAFEDWLAGCRSELLEQVMKALLALAEGSEAAGDHDRALGLARRALVLDPLREAAQRQAMRSLAALGQRAAALRQYEIGRRLLAEELQVTPDDDTEMLRDAISRGGEELANGPSDPRVSARYAVEEGLSVPDRQDSKAPGPAVGARTASRSPAHDHRKAAVVRLAWPLAALMLIVGGGGVWWLGKAPSPPPAQVAVAGMPTVPVTPVARRLSIVVLPFTNLSGDPDQDFFADGLTDEVTTDLSRIDDSFVIARHTAFTYKGKSVDVRELGRELGIRYVLEGSVRRAGSRIHLDAKLIDTATGGSLWAERFEGTRDELLALPNEVTGRIAATLRLELIEAEGRRLEHEHRFDSEALDDAMRGWALLYRPYSRENRQEARRLFERAIATDPNTVGALIGLAYVLQGRSDSPAEDRERADGLLRHALDLEPNRASAHFVLGLVRRSKGRFQEAVDALQKAITLDPNYADAYFQLGETLLFLGRPEEAIPLAERATRLNPHDPSIGEHFWVIGSAHLLSGRLDEAIEMLESARFSSPRLWYVHLYLAAAYGLAERLEEARQELVEHLRLRPEFDSRAAIRAHIPSSNHPAFMEQAARTLDVGLRRAGMPDS